MRIGDDVVAQGRPPREHFGIEEPAQPSRPTSGRCFPEKVKRAVSVAGTAKNTSHYSLYAEALMDAITNDSGYRGGVYDTPFDVREGLVQHGLFWSVMGLSTQWRKQECWRPPGFVDAYFSVLDPHSLLARGWKWRRGDVSRYTGGDFSAALGRIMAKTLVMPISEGMFFPPRDCAAEQTLIPGSELRVIEDIGVHWALFRNLTDLRGAGGPEPQPAPRYARPNRFEARDLGAYPTCRYSRGIAALQDHRVAMRSRSRLRNEGTLHKVARLGCGVDTMLFPGT